MKRRLSGLLPSAIDSPVLLATLEPITVSEGQQRRLTRDSTAEREECTICCAEEARYALSTNCGGNHFYCADCVRRTLVAALEAGQFPALCPGCRADGDTGMIDESALGWLASRGVIDKTLLQRLVEQQRRPEGKRPPSSVPVGAGCCWSRAALAARGWALTTQRAKTQHASRSAFDRRDRSTPTPKAGPPLSFSGAAPAVEASAPAASSRHKRRTDAPT